MKVDFCTAIRYNIKRKSTEEGGVPMNNINPLIMESITKNNNMVTTSQVLALGFSKQILNKYVKEGLLSEFVRGFIFFPMLSMTICIR